MNRKIKSFLLKDATLFKRKLFNWSEKFSTSIYLDSNKYPSRLGDIDAVLACEVQAKLPFTDKDSLNKLKSFINKTNDWLFGYFSYDLKNEIEDLESDNNSQFSFPNLFFFQPKKIWIVKSNIVEAQYLNESDIEKDWKQINSINLLGNSKNSKSVKLAPKLSKNEYENKIKKILNHIHRGNIYEANFCMEWCSTDTMINPEEVYKRLNFISKTPMSAFFKQQNIYLLSTSPERFIKRIGNKIISQPIKGTSRRDSNKTVDLKLMRDLEKNPKERSENVMIVDLVRNDLSKFSISGSVKVTELCKIYPFKQVHQMISTVESKIDSKINIVDIIKSTFPMGSMTGAPKLKALEIIEDLEVSKRGLYSGAIGYIDPNGDFDFNVVIRSLIYDSINNYLSFHVGSAITSNSTPEHEYEECLLKAKPMMSILK